jgi:hypothetical protein
VHTADDGQLLLAYLATEGGIKWFRSLSDVEPLPAPPYSKVTIVEKTHPLLRHFGQVFGANQGGLEAAWHYYLAAELWPRGQPPDVFWRRRHGPWGSSADGNLRRSWFVLAEMALVMIRLPCSEAAVARVFSHLRFVLGTRRQSMGEDLLDAILVVRMNDSPSVHALDQSFGTLGTRVQGSGGSRLAPT